MREKSFLLPLSLRSLRPLLSPLLLAVAFLIATTIASADVVVRSLDHPVDLSGLWKFQPGDDSHFATPQFDDRNWANIRVPLPWGRQGYKSYSGVAWYR